MSQEIPNHTSEEFIGEIIQVERSSSRYPGGGIARSIVVRPGNGLAFTINNLGPRGLQLKPGQTVRCSRLREDNPRTGRVKYSDYRLLAVVEA